jgi:hypothetical protein
VIIDLCTDESLTWGAPRWIKNRFEREKLIGEKKLTLIENLALENSFCCAMKYEVRVR